MNSKRKAVISINDTVLAIVLGLGVPFFIISPIWIVYYLTGGGD